MSIKENFPEESEEHLQYRMPPPRSPEGSLAPSLPGNKNVQHIPTCFHITTTSQNLSPSPDSFEQTRGAHTYTCILTMNLFAFSMETELPRKVPWRPLKIYSFTAISQAIIQYTFQNKRELHPFSSILFLIVALAVTCKMLLSRRKTG